MPQLSLKELAAGREGVVIQSILCRRIKFGRTSDEALDLVGFSDLKAGGGPPGILYGLPTLVAAGETVLHVQLNQFPQNDKAADRDEWSLVWERLTQHLVDTVPDDLVEESQKFGGSAGLDDRVAKLWADHPSNDTTRTFLTVDYRLVGWTTKLVSPQGKQIGVLEVQQTGSFWDVHGGVVVGISLVESSKRTREHGKTQADLVMSVVGKFDSHGGPHNARILEQKMWDEVQQLVERMT